MATVTDKPYWTAANAGSSMHSYHRREDCPQLNSSDPVRRSDNYVRYHELSECRVCRPLDNINSFVVVHRTSVESTNFAVHFDDPDTFDPTPLCGTQTNLPRSEYVRTTVPRAESRWNLCYRCAGGRLDKDDDRPLQAQINAVLEGDE